MSTSYSDSDTVISGLPARREIVVTRYIRGIVKRANVTVYALLTFFVPTAEVCGFRLTYGVREAFTDFKPFFIGHFLTSPSGIIGQFLYISE